MSAALAGRVGPIPVSDSEVDRKQRFRDIYRRHGPSVLGYGLRRLPDPQDAADVCAEVFIVVWRRIDDVPGDDGLLPWLYRCAANVISNQLRGQRRQLAVAGRLRDHVSTLTADRDDRRLDSVAEALASLSGPDRELLQLTVWEELTPAEIAQVLDLDAGVVRSRLHRARTRLRAAMKTATADGSVAELARPAQKGSEK